MGPLFGKAHMTLSRREMDEAGACVGAVCEAVGWDMELLIECHGRFNHFSFRSKITNEEVVYDNDCVEIPNKRGLGIELDEDLIQTRPYAPHLLRHYTGTLTDIRSKDDTVYYFKGWDAFSASDNPEIST